MNTAHELDNLHPSQLCSGAYKQQITKIFDPFLEKAFHIDKLKGHYQSLLKQELSSVEIIRHFLKDTGIKAQVSGLEALTEIPKDRPVIFVANHPLGFLDGLLLVDLLADHCKNFKIMADKILSSFAEMNDIMIPVESYNRKHSSSSGNIKAVRHALKHLEAQGSLAVFPSGSVSHFKMKDRKINDDNWHPAIAKLARKSGATVVPIYFSGKNSLSFHLMNLIHPMASNLLLPKEAFTSSKKELRIHIGKAINAREISKISDDEQLARFLRLRCYLLKTDKKEQCKEIVKDKTQDSYAGVIPAIPSLALAKDILALKDERKLLDFKDFTVYYASWDEIPNIRQEIGRLREISFRDVGEGTGESIDLDEFDRHYKQLFIWNNKEQEIVGAYRFGEVRKIIEEQGINGLYTNRFYKFSKPALEKFKCGLELGRSFVRKEYQRSPYSLMLLWKGICEYVYRNDDCYYLFGAVSISDNYDDRSRYLMAQLLHEHGSEIKARRHYRPRFKPEKEIKSICHNYHCDELNELSSLIRSVEKDGKDIPVLIKQYHKMGGRLTAFTVDKDFGSTLDGLISVDLRKTDLKLLKMYMGDKAHDFVEQHRTED